MAQEQQARQAGPHSSEMGQAPSAGSSTTMQAQAKQARDAVLASRAQRSVVAKQTAQESSGQTGWLEE